MGATKIQWVDAVWNVTTGCTPCAKGCERCYAQRMAKRLAGRFGYPADEPFRVTLHPDRLDEPLRWRKPRRVFVCSMGDLFHASVPDEFIERVFETMREASHHEYLLLTKRPERYAEYWEWRRHVWLNDRTTCVWPSNVWAGTSCSTQADLDRNVPYLLRCPATIRFLSCEPLLNAVDLSAWLSIGKSSWNQNQDAPRPSEICDTGEQQEQPSRQSISSGPQCGTAAETRTISDMRGTAAAESQCASDGETSPRFLPTWDNGQVPITPSKGLKTMETTNLEIAAGLPVPSRTEINLIAAGLQRSEKHSRSASGGGELESTEEPSAAASPVEKRQSQPCRYKHKLSWAICGCESGPRRRSVGLDAIRSLRDQCVAAGVPFFLKQAEIDGKLVKMPALDGKVWNQFPEVTR